LIVADSSFIIEGLLRKKRLLEEDTILTLDLALYEVTNSIWKHHYILKDLEDGLPYLSIFFGLIDAGTIRMVSPTDEIMKQSYLLATRNKLSIYDTAFVSLALKSGLELKTFDKQQNSVMLHESRRS